MNDKRREMFLDLAIWDSNEMIQKCVSTMFWVIDEWFHNAKEIYEKRFPALTYDEQIQLQRDMIEWLFPAIKARLDKFRQDYILSNWIKQTWNK